MECMSTRRGFLRTAVSATAVPVVVPRAWAGKKGIVPTMVDAAAAAPIDIQPLRGNIAVLEGSGGNIAVFSGPDGKLMVDSGFRVSKAKLTEAVRSVGPGPIKHLVNTHWHTDHTDGNEWLHASGASITAHENTRKHLSKATRVEGWDYTFPAAAAAAVPAQVFASEHELGFNGSKLVLKYYGPAHTDSDISVYFSHADVFHTGDTWWNGVYPFIDYSTGGSIDGSIRAAEANVRAVSSDTLVVPGHGPVGGRTDLIEFRDMLVDIREKVAKLKKQGRSLAEVIAAKPTARWDAKWGQFLMTPSTMTGLAYQGV